MEELSVLEEDGVMDVSVSWLPVIVGDEKLVAFDVAAV
jgi:hypothetical protein